MSDQVQVGLEGYPGENWFPDPLSGLNPAPDITLPPIFDRRLDVELVLHRIPPGGLEAGVRFNFGTGLPYTRSLGRYTHFFPQLLGGVGLQWTDELVNKGADPEMAYGVALSERHITRYPARHRLDLSLRWTMRSSWGRATPYLNVLSVYNWENVLLYFHQYD